MRRQHQSLAVALKTDSFVFQCRICHHIRRSGRQLSSLELARTRFGVFRCIILTHINVEVYHCEAAVVTNVFIRLDISFRYGDGRLCPWLMFPDVNQGIIRDAPRTKRGRSSLTSYRCTPT